MGVSPIKPNTVFEMNAKLALHTDELQALTLLYQPLISYGGISLFLTLNSLAANSKVRHHLLLQILNTNMEQLLEWRYKLEAVGLLAVYEKQKAAYTYVLKRPLTPESFFNDGIINVFLNLKVGQEEYMQIKQMFMATGSEPLGEQVTKTFNEVFDTNILLYSKQVQNVSPLSGAATSKTGIELSQTLNEEVLRAILKQQGLEEKVLSDKLFEQLNQMAFLYKLDEHELARLILDALDVNGFVNLQSLRKQAKQYFGFVSKGQPIKLVEKCPHQPQIATTPMEAKEEQLLAFLSQNPLDFLRYKAHQKEPVPADKQLVEWLFIDQQMPAGVVNILIDYVLKIAEGKLPKQLVEKIAGQWQRKEINTIQKAMAQVKQARAAKKKRETEKQMPIALNKANGRVIRKEVVPDWLYNQEATTGGKDSPSEADLHKIERMKKLQSQILDQKG